MIEAHSMLYKIANRNYVTPALNQALQEISQNLDQKHHGIKVVYLDANFPFIKGFPLFPHLSHNDGKKVDLSFIYSNKDKQLVNLKPSNSGYGVFEEPLKQEYNQIEVCKNQGFWQYDYAQYLTLGKKEQELTFSIQGNRTLLQTILQQISVKKVFIEPHLKTRMKLQHHKLRFHGCRAVRHDDHIHFQL
ncbi:hypothetical protein GCM10023331_28720 [Algivirga pacifica]|uniref:Uncharacterized protein n=2 Tax=Algivirga pacifica TaxID=1162670 RepID=A0ABP9DE04_9BACT